MRPENALTVVFIGEEAVVDGGPRREFFTGNDDDIHNNWIDCRNNSRTLLFVAHCKYVITLEKPSTAPFTIKRH